MTNTSSFYTRDVAQSRHRHFSRHQSKNDSTKIFINTAVGCLEGASTFRILDLGTGNGFVAKTISQKAAELGLKVVIYAIDLSDAMLEEASSYCKNYRNIKIEKRDNISTGYQDDYFDLVVAKNVTSFDAEEIHRILKTSGKLVMKEYGKGKGLLEVTALFPGRVTSRTPEEIVAEFRLQSWQHIRYTQFFYRFQMSLRDVQDTLKVAPIIQSFSWVRDKEVILGLFEKHEKVSIISDPWILYAEK